MLPLSEIRLFIILIVSILSVSKVSTEDECEDTKFIVSECDKTETYQWLIQVPKRNDSCPGKSIPQPKSIPCHFICSKGKSMDKNTLQCEDCPEGTFSLGGGQQYTFDKSMTIKSTPGLLVRAVGLISTHDSQCKTEKLWKIKGNVLQGEVQQNCAMELILSFKLDRAGSITITYSLPTSYIFGIIESRCDFVIDDDGDDDDDESDSQNEMKRRVEVKLPPTGYGTWKDKNIKIDAAGEYKLTLYIFGLNSVHFPFSVRSIIVEGNTFLQECIPCPPGTYSSKSGSGNCTSCPINSYTSKSGSTKCKQCDDATEYSDDSSTKCSRRPDCQLKDYQKVFTGCDESNTATFEYNIIQPKICVHDVTPPAVAKIPCGTCNPGLFKNEITGKCEFCPSKSYSNGTLKTCLPCSNDLSLIPGLYYKTWNEFPIYLSRAYIFFDETRFVSQLDHNRSWIPSITYIASQALPDILSVLSLTIDKGFRRTELTKANGEYGTLYFKFSVECQSFCILTVVSQDIYNDDFDEWNIIHKWRLNQTLGHTNIIEYTSSIRHPNEIMFNWLFATESNVQGVDELRIYEIRVTNTINGGSDRCVSCLTMNNEETACKACSPGHILWNNTCIRCPPSTIASRLRPNDPVSTVCTPCINNTVSDDGVSCIVPCKQTFHADIQYDLNGLLTLEFHGSKLFTQKGSGYFHVFNASICGPTSVTCAKTLTLNDLKHPSNQLIINSKLCRMGVVPDKDGSNNSVAYIDDFGEQLVNISVSTSKLFPPLRSDYNLTDLTFVYRANTTNAQSTCSEHITYLSLRCDHDINDAEQKNLSVKYKLQTPSSCATGTCDGCTFHFLLRTPLACPSCDEDMNGFRTFHGPCKLGRQEIRKIPYPYCSQNLTEKVEFSRCSIFSTEIQIIVGLFVCIAIMLSSLVLLCWRKNRRLEYRYMQLTENASPDDDTPANNVCAQISDEEDSGDEVQFKKQSRTKTILNVVRNAIRKNPTNNGSDTFAGDSFLLAGSSSNDA